MLESNTSGLLPFALLNVVIQFDGQVFANCHGQEGNQFATIADAAISLAKKAITTSSSWHVNRRAWVISPEIPEF